MEVRSAYVTLPDVRIYCEDAGRGFPLVLLHPGSADLRFWEEQFLVFAREYRAIRCDLRGHGRSDSVNGQFYSHVLDLHRMLNAIHVERAFILGCGLGASIAIDFAIEYPEAAAGLVLVNPALSGYSYETTHGAVRLLPADVRTVPPVGVIRCPVITINGDPENEALAGGLEQIGRALPGAKKAQLPGERLLPNLNHPAQFNRIVLTFLEWAAAAESAQAP